MKTNIDHNDFHPNLQRAKVAELSIGEKLNKFKDLHIESQVNDDKRWDLYGTYCGKPIHFEVKEDFRCFGVEDGKKATGNIPVEYESRGKPSGIDTTEADFWVFRVHYNDRVYRDYVIGVDRLNRLIEEDIYDRKYQMPHTDSKNRVFFFKYDTLIQYCAIINNIK